MRLKDWQYSFNQVVEDFTLFNAGGKLPKGAEVKPIAVGVPHLRILVQSEVEKRKRYTWVSLDELDPDTLPPELAAYLGKKRTVTWEQWQAENTPVGNS